MSFPDLFIGEVVEEENPRKRALGDTLGPYWRKGPVFSIDGRRPSARQARRHIRDYAAVIHAEMNARPTKQRRKKRRRRPSDRQWRRVLVSHPSALPQARGACSCARCMTHSGGCGLKNIRALLRA